MAAEDAPSKDGLAEPADASPEPEAEPAAPVAEPVPDAPETPAAEPAGETRLVRVWRPGRMGGERPRGGREERGGQRNRRGGAPAARSEAGEVAGNNNRPARRPERRDGANPGRLGEGDQRRGDREERGGKGGKPRFEKRGAEKPVAEPRRVEKPRVADPDSPFAKLAALKDKLKR